MVIRLVHFGAGKLSLGFLLPNAIEKAASMAEKSQIVFLNRLGNSVDSLRILDANMITVWNGAEEITMKLLKFENDQEIATQDLDDVTLILYNEHDCSKLLSSLLDKADYISASLGTSGLKSLVEKISPLIEVEKAVPFISIENDYKYAATILQKSSMKKNFLQVIADRVVSSRTATYSKILIESESFEGVMFALNPVNHYLPFVCDTYSNSDIAMFMFDAKIHMVNHIHAAWALLSMIKNVEEASPDMDMMANYESDDLKMIEAWGIANALHLVDETNTKLETIELIGATDEIAKILMGKMRNSIKRFNNTSDRISRVLAPAKIEQHFKNRIEKIFEAFPSKNDDCNPYQTSVIKAYDDITDIGNVRVRLSKIFEKMRSIKGTWYSPQENKA